MKIINIMRYRCYAFALTVLLGSSCGNKMKDVVVPDPKANFSYTVDEENTLKIKFTNESEAAVSYAWDFGGTEGASINENPTYTYTSAGTYDVILTAWNSVGTSAMQKKTITVEPNTTLGKVSILGDSYSTFRDYVTPASNSIWYPSSNMNIKNNVVQVEQTWWHLFLQTHNGTMEINNSFSGSTVCNTGYDGSNSSATSFIARMPNLGNPDMIIIMGGTNDAWANSPIGSYKYRDWTDDDKKSFRPAFAYMLDYLSDRYPNAKIVNVVNSGLKAEITDSQAEICMHYGIMNIQLTNIDKQDGHPSINGMKAIKNQISSVLFPQL